MKWHSNTDLKHYRDGPAMQDISPLESMHVSHSFQVAYGARERNWGVKMHPEIRNVLRASLIELVLGEASSGKELKPGNR